MPANAKRKAVPTLTLHRQTGQWSKCFSLPNGRRKTVYFGTDPDAAMAKYLAERDEWQAGRNPRENAVVQRSTALTLSDAINAFLSRSKGRVSTGELSPRTFADYLDTGRALTAHFGRNRDPGSLRPQDFGGFRAALATKYAPSRLSKHITITKMIFRWAFESETIDQLPRFGPDFKVAGKRAERSAKAEAGGKLLTAAEINATLKKAGPVLQAMILLGINGGLGNADIAALPLDALDLDGGWLNFPRPKTGVDRRVPLWPETIKAIRTALASREPRDECTSLVFVTSRGRPWVRVNPDGKRVDGIVPHFRKACIAAGVHRPRMGFYWLRHTFQTIGDEARDPLATAHVMGHADGTIGGNYRERISDDRLQRVTEHVREWLNGAKPKAKGTPKAKGKPRLRIVG